MTKKQLDTSTASARALVDWLEHMNERGVSRVEVARVLAVSPSAITRWSQGSTRPDYLERVAIERISDGCVSLAGWSTERELAQQETRKARVAAWVRRRK